LLHINALMDVLVNLCFMLISCWYKNAVCNQLKL